MVQSSCAPGPSYVTLPDQEFASLLDFLDSRFQKVGRDVWRARIEAGKVTDDEGYPITLNTPYRPHTRLRYYREVESEPKIPFAEHILFQNDHLLVVCKPHFLPVTPSGPYVNESLLYRLKASTGIADLAPIHRLDRETAGLVMFSVNQETRGVYHQLFSAGQVHKIYEAIATLPDDPDQQEWLVQSRIAPGDLWFLMKNAEGPVNAVTRIYLTDKNACHAYFRLEPATGKQHQLRLHLNLIGSKILNDRLYPVLQPKSNDVFTRPLQLLAKELRFLDPISLKTMEFRSTRTLPWEHKHPAKKY